MAEITTNRGGDDSISRKWLLECVEGWIKFDTEKDKNTFIHLVRDIAPSAQPTFYGYGIKHLAFVASIMKKEGVSPEEAVAIFRDTDRLTQIIFKEIQEAQEKTFRQALESFDL